MSWSLPLAEPVTLKNSRVLLTLDDAAQLLLRLSDKIQARAWNQHAADLLMTAAESGDAGDIEEATRQVERALGREGML